MSSKQRLHPVAIILNFITFIRHSIFAFIAGYFAFNGGQSQFYFILGVIGILALFLIGSLLTWWRFTYIVVDDEIRIEQGIFVRKKRYISKNRIQSIDLTANVLHRIFGLVKVQIETASSGGAAEASLSAVRKSEGERIRNELKSLTSNIDRTVETEKQQEPIQKISFGRLFIAGTTSGSIGVILALVVFASQELEQFIPDTVYENTITWLIGLSLLFIVGIIIVILILLWLLGIAGTMIKYGNFTITKNEKELFITRGLLEKKQLTIPLNRIQAVGIKQNIIRQPFGFVTLFAVVAGGSMDKAEDFPVLFPIMKESEVEQFLSTFLPNYSQLSHSIHQLPKRAMKFYLFRSSAIFILLIGIVGYLFMSFIWIPVVLFLLSLLLGFLRYKDAGYVFEEKRLTIQYRLISKVKMVMFHRRIQAFEEKQHKIQRLQKLATVTISIIGSLGAGNHYRIKDLDETGSAQLEKWYSYRS